MRKEGMNKNSTDQIEREKAEKRAESYLAELRELRAFIADAAAFMRWAQLKCETITEMQKLITATLGHDIGGLARGESCFSPRVSGYAAREARDSDGVYSSHAAAMHAQARRELYPPEE
jgi:hypothetical protein